ncbi:MAG: hypothetical protein JXR96_21805 [Deltaproteobacteria bacterium]|nr:hypothetical protein [Deltaproteobacteria bacterium]
MLSRYARTALLSAALLASGPATAQDAPGKPASPKRLGVLVLPGDQVAMEQRRAIQQALLAEAFLRSGDTLDWQLVAFPSVGSPPDAVGREALTQLIEQGKKHYRYLKLDKAQESFEQAGALLQRMPLAQCQANEMAKMYYYWARAALDSGDDTAAQALLGQVQRFDPKAGPDPATMPPNLVAAYDMALDSRRARKQAKVLLQIKPGKGTLYVDCQSQPVGVVQISGVVGDEFLVAADVEEGSFGSRFALQEGPRRHLEIFSARTGDAVHISLHMLELAKQKVILDAVRGKTQADLDGLARLHGVEVLLVAEPRAQEGEVVRLALYVPGRGVIGEPVEVPLGRTGNPDPDVLSGAFDGLAKAIAGPSMLAALAPPAEPEPKAIPGKDEGLRDDDREEPLIETWWFWAAVGGGALVVGAVLTGVLVGTSGGSEPSGEVVLTINPP